jgi:hypothetical protein
MRSGLRNHHNRGKHGISEHSPGVTRIIESVQKTMQKEKNLYRVGRGCE